MKKVFWLFFVLVLSGCATSKMVVVVKSVQTIENEPVEFEVQYELTN